MKPATLADLTTEGYLRVVIENITPQVDCGRFPVKRTPDQTVAVTADLFTDGHDVVTGDVLFRKQGHKRWLRVPLEYDNNDLFRASFDVTELGRYDYTVEAWVDPFETWRRDLVKRRAANQDLSLALEIGAQIIEGAAERSSQSRTRKLKAWADAVRDDKKGITDIPELVALMRSNPAPQTVRRYPQVLEVIVEPQRARFSSWYEFFPRSCGENGVHGTFDACHQRLEYAARLGFNIVYFPPVHPIGTTARKGPNNDPEGGTGVDGSPWAIGARAGGHKSIHPELGTLEDFKRLLQKAQELQLDVALDIAFQCSPDHPYVKKHEEWYRHRPDGTIQYAENPPKKYQDIYPLDFESADYKSLWTELHSVIAFWIDQGVTIFRVDNPHTKAFRFWEWCINKIKQPHPEVIFLSEAFTRPKVMHHLAKLGFSQSYTYFTWRTGKQELIEYFTELGLEDGREYFRPNVWPNTPDILHEYLQLGGRPAFMIRLLLAATLTANYGIYGPAFELCEHRPLKPGSEEYLDSEKYQLRQWDVARPDSIADLIATVNRIRNSHAALQNDWNVAFHPIENDYLMAYTKREGDELLLMVVTLDYNEVQSGWVQLPLEALGLPTDRVFIAHDLLTNARYEWQGQSNFVMLDPNSQPGHILRLVDLQRHDYDFPDYL